MAISQGKSTRSPSGARRVANRGKRKSELGRESAETRLGERKLRKIRTRGGNEKQRLAQDNKINVIDADGKAQTVEIYGVIENNANPNYVRRNIITKGGLIRIRQRAGENAEISVPDAYEAVGGGVYRMR